MANKKAKQSITVDAKHIINNIVLALYGYVTVFTPNWRTFDSNGPKFMTLSMLNILVFTYLLLNKEYKLGDWIKQTFFKSKIAISYSLMMFFALLSLIVAYNKGEAILHYAKVLTPFVGAILIAFIVYHDRKSLRLLAFLMSILLIFDSVTVFSAINKYVNGKIGSINEIKSVYSNKNILASSIFVKITFSLWLMLYENKKVIRYFGAFTLFLAFLATLFLSTRAFYLGMILIAISMTVYLLYFYKKTKNKQFIHSLISLAVVLITSASLFIIIEKVSYPKEKQDSRSLTGRLASITKKGTSSNLRITAWKRSLNMIKDNPLLGIGIGNWKIKILEQEQATSHNYTYMYKNHNDFLETTAETGIFGGLAFLAIFVFMFLHLISLIRKTLDEERIKFAFIAAIGLLTYAVDAFFNFPQDRPEIQALFALFVGIAIATTLWSHVTDEEKEEKIVKRSHPFSYVILSLLSIIMIGTTFILIWNFNSLKLQRIIAEDIRSGKKLAHHSSEFLDEFPPIPNLNVLAEPIAVQKARYLINEKKYDEALALLHADDSNPMDMRKEYFIATIYNSMKKYDSVAKYADKVISVKPMFFNTRTLKSIALEKLGKKNESRENWKNYVHLYKKNKIAWQNTANLCASTGELEKSVQYLDTARMYFPKDSVINTMYFNNLQNLTIKKHSKLYVDADQKFKAKKYKESNAAYNILLDSVPNFILGYERQAFNYYYQGKYKEAIKQINIILDKRGYLTPSQHNFRGAAYHATNQMDKACKDFKTAMKAGDKDGINNYNKICKSKKKNNKAKDVFGVFN